MKCPNCGSKHFAIDIVAGYEITRWNDWLQALEHEASIITESSSIVICLACKTDVSDLAETYK